MSKGRRKLENQLAFNFDRKIEEYTTFKNDLLNTHPEPTVCQSHEETCIEIAATVKRMYRDSGMSREQMVDAINEYFRQGSGIRSATLTADKDQGAGKEISIHMLNH